METLISNVNYSSLVSRDHKSNRSVIILIIRTHASLATPSYVISKNLSLVDLVTCTQERDH